MTERHHHASARRDALADAIYGAAAQRRAAAERVNTPADEDMSFRARMESRRRTRPQSTLAIVSGIQYPALAKSHTQAKTPVRAEPRVQPVAPAQPMRAPVQHVQPFRLATLSPRLIAAASSTLAGALPAPSGGRGGLGFGNGGGSDDEGAGSRLGDISQFAFASLAVLGLAGLSVMAAQSALSGDDSTDSDTVDTTRTVTQLDPGLGPDGGNGQAPIKAGDASVLALASAVQPASATYTPWFDYKGVAAQLVAQREAYAAEQKNAEDRATAEAELQAATAIADAEAARLAEEQRLAQEAEDARLADAAAEKKRLADLEAQRVAEAEAIRQAKLEAEQKAAREAEAKRQADLEAKRLAAAEAETQRLANLEAKRLADLKATREAQAEANRLAALQARADDEAAVNLASFKTDDAAKTSTVRVAPTPKDKPTQITRKPIVFAAYTGPIPAAASLKPEKPMLVRASATSLSGLDATRPVTRAAPESYATGAPTVRPFTQLQQTALTSQAVEDFIASRVERTASAPLDETAVTAMQADFLNIVNTAADGSVTDLATPDGRQVSILIEQTVTRETHRNVVRTISYSVSEYNAVQRNVSQPELATIPVLCRDIFYAIPGQERGRFAACENGKGDWRISRATDTPQSSI